MTIINDNYIKKRFFCKDNRINSKHVKTINDDELHYLNNRYTDSLCLHETLQRIFYGIEIHPKCPTCGNLLPYYGKPLSKIGIFLHHCNVSCANSDPNVYNKQNETKLEHYGSKNNYKKIKQSMLEKYAIDNMFNHEDVRKNNIKSICSYKSKQKRKMTCLQKYGVDSYTKTEQYRHNYLDNLKNYKEKEYNTKKKNSSFNISKPEDESHAILKEYYPDIVSQYKDNRYPFACDFYIPSLDLFIECNYHWTHGGKPYEGTEDDMQIVEKWKSKGTKFYFNAIQTWTIRDVNKRNIAKQNKLNYIEFWNIDEIKKWLMQNYDRYKSISRKCS